MGNKQGRVAAEDGQDREFPHLCDPAIVIDPSPTNDSETSKTGTEEKPEMPIMGRVAAEDGQDTEFPHPCDPFSGLVIDPSSPIDSETSKTGSEDRTEMTVTEKSSAEDGFNEIVKLFSYIGRDDELKSSEEKLSAAEFYDEVQEIISEYDPISNIILDDEEPKIDSKGKESKGKANMAKKGSRAGRFVRFVLGIMAVGILLHNSISLVLRKILGIEDGDLKTIKEELNSIKTGQADISNKVETSTKGIKDTLKQGCDCCKGRIIILKLADNDKEKKLAGNVPQSEASNPASSHPSPPASTAPGYASQLEASNPESSHPSPPACPASEQQ